MNHANSSIPPLPKSPKSPLNWLFTEPEARLRRHPPYLRPRSPPFPPPSPDASLLDWGEQTCWKITMFNQKIICWVHPARFDYGCRFFWVCFFLVFLGHFSLLFVTFWHKNLHFAKFLSENLPFALFIRCWSTTVLGLNSCIGCYHSVGWFRVYLGLV